MAEITDCPRCGEMSLRGELCPKCKREEEAAKKDGKKDGKKD